MFKKLQRSISMVLILALVITNMIGIIMPETAVADNVLTVAEAIANNSGTATVEGYIVGHTTGGSDGSANYNFEEPFANDYNFAIADSADETQSEKIMPVQITSSYRAQFGLKTNPGLIGKKVRITGSLETYFTVPALKSPSAIEIVDEASTELQIDYPNPITSADAYSTVAVNFSVVSSVYGEGNTVTASVYSKAVSAQGYTVTEATYSEDDGVYIYTADIQIGGENVEYYIEAADSEGETSKTSVYEIQVQSYDDKDNLLSLVGRFTAQGANGEKGVAEIVKYDKVSKKAFIVNGAENAVSVDIVDLSALDTSSGNVEQLILSQKISINDLPDFGDGFIAGDITCIDIHPSGQYFAVSLPNDTKTNNGRVAFFAIDDAYTYKGFVEVGALPDNLTFTPDGNTLLVANEGEPNSDYSIDPEGSVSVIDVSGGVDSITQDLVTTASFDGITIDEDVIIKEGAQIKNDLEPEYIVVDESSKYAYVALQENNAVATLDIAQEKFIKVAGLGFKDWSMSVLDASNKDGKINIQPWPVLGMYMPDGLDIATINGNDYIFTANEGDGREYDNYENEIGVEDIEDKLALNADHYAGYTQDQLDAMISTLGDKKNLGKLNVHVELGLNDTGDYEALYTFGGRSFSIYNTSDFSQVYDSGSDFEKITALRYPDEFNTTNDEVAFDNRSDNKGPEPEDIKVGKVGDKYYAFIGLERVGGIMVYDVTEPASAEFVQYINTRDFSQDIAGDCAPEGIKFIPAEDSPSGSPLLLVANEVSGTLAVFEVKYDGGQVSEYAIAKARAKTAGDTVTAEGIVTSTNNIYIQDNTGGICLYKQEGSNITLEQGDKIRVTGKLTSYNELLEISPFTVDEVISKGNVLPMPQKVTISQIGEDYEGELVKLEGVKLGDINTGGTTVLTDGANKTIGIYKIPELSGVFAGDTVDVTAIVSQYKTTYQLHVRSAADVTKSQSAPAAVEPVFYTAPANMMTTYEVRPEISLTYEEGEKSLVSDSAQLEVDGAVVETVKTYDAETKQGTVTYTPMADLSIGEHEVRFTIKDAENAEYEKGWSFTIIENQDDFNVYFGIPHAHTSYSDGQGTPAEAYAHAHGQDLDFLIITDHSNQLEGDQFDSSNNRFTPIAESEWVKTKEMADAFNSAHAGEFLAMRGFEWTHSSNGHMNAYDSDNYTEAKKTMTEIADFYDWLEKEEVVAAFNHPNWPSDSFNNLAYDADADRWVKMIEAGNGAPPYSYARSIEYYYKALDNGWHVGATNAQDNHTMNWGDPDNFTGVLAEDLTFESFIEAFKAHRVYSTETRNLVLKVKANDYWMGSILKLSDGEKLNFDIYAADDDDTIQTLELITNGGQVIDTQSVNGNSTQWTPEVTSGSGNHWYVVKVTHTNGKIGISSPIWTTGAENDVKLTELVVDPQPALPGIKSDIMAYVTNFGARAVENLEVKFYHTSVSEGNLIGTAAIDRIAAGEKKTAHVEWTPSGSGEVNIIAKLTPISGVTTVTQLSKTVLVVTPNNKNILIDQSHGNADVPGTVGDFVKLLRTYGYSAEFNTQEISAETLANIDVLVLGAPTESKPLSAGENTAISQWVKAGGSLLIADKSNYGYNNQLLNTTLEELDSGIRFSNDNVYEPEDSDKYSGGMVWSVYMETFPEAAWA